VDEEKVLPPEMVLQSGGEKDLHLVEVPGLGEV
jgi:hypothetical protein